MPRRASIWPTVLTAVMVIGCSATDEAASADDQGDPSEPDPDDPCVPGPNPSLEIGEGEYSFSPYEDGATIELIHGPQGGVHTLTGLVARDLDIRGELSAELRGYVGDTQLGGSFPYLNFRCQAGDGQQVWGVFLFWDAPPEDLHMQSVRIEAEFTDASGTTVTATKQAVIFDPTL